MITSMISWFVVFVFIAANGVSAATLASLQSEGDAIYDMSQAMPALVTAAGKNLCKPVDLVS